MSADEHKAVVRRHLLEFMSQDRLDLAEELFSPDLIFNGERWGPEGMRKLAAGRRGVYPDLEYRIEELLAAEGDRIACRWSWSGTHRGEDLGIPATGKRVTVRGISIFRLRDGKIAEVWVVRNDLPLLRQLGAESGLRTPASSNPPGYPPVDLR